MTQRTSSPVPETDHPYVPPEPQSIAQEDTKKENEFASLGLDKKYPEVVAYLRDRQEHWKKFRPGGIPIADVTPENYYEYIVAEMTAANVIAEFEAFINIIEVSKSAVRANQR